MVTTVGGPPPAVLVSLGGLTPKNLTTGEKILPATLPAVETLGEGAGAARASASGLLTVSTVGLVVEEGVKKPADGAGGTTNGAVPAAVEIDKGELAGAPVGGAPGCPNGSIVESNGN